MEASPLTNRLWNAHPAGCGTAASGQLPTCTCCTELETLDVLLVNRLAIVGLARNESDLVDEVPIIITARKIDVFLFKSLGARVPDGTGVSTTGTLKKSLVLTHPMWWLTVQR